MQRHRVLPRPVHSLQVQRDVPRRIPAGEQLDSMRAMLIEQREFRIDQLVLLDATRPVGRTDGADADIVRTLETAARAALRDVQSALRRMDAGHYGHCVRCGQPVGLERLEILPQAALCMPCHRSSDAPGPTGAPSSPGASTAPGTPDAPGATATGT